MVEAQWSDNYSHGFNITVHIDASDRSGLLSDITTVIANEKINVLGIKSRSDTYKQSAQIDIDMEAYNIDDLTKMLAKLNQVPSVISAKRL